MATNPSWDKFETLAGNPKVTSVVDFGYYQLTLSVRRFWVQLNRPIALPQVPLLWVMLPFIPAPEPVWGSTKAGVELQHPQWTLLGGTRATITNGIGCFWFYNSNGAIHWENGFVWCFYRPNGSSPWQCISPAMYFPAVFGHEGDGNVCL